MLEHTDRHDAVVATVLVPVVLEPEADALGESGLVGAAVRVAMLLRRERHAGDVHFGRGCEMERKAAPARSDVEHALARSQQELGRDMPHLPLLGLLQRVVGRRVVGAGILTAGVEEEPVEFVRQIVMVRDIGTGDRDGIVLREPPHEPAAQRPHAAHQVGAAPAEIGEAKIQQIVDAATLEEDGAVHIALAEREVRVADQAPDRRRVGDPHRDRGVAAAEAVGAMVGGDNGQRALADDPAQQAAEQEHADVGLPPAPAGEARFRTQGPYGRGLRPVMLDVAVHDVLALPSFAPGLWPIGRDVP